MCVPETEHGSSTRAANSRWATTLVPQFLFLLWGGVLLCSPCWLVSCYIDQVAINLVILLPLSSEHWDYRYYHNCNFSIYTRQFSNHNLSAPSFGGSCGCFWEGFFLSFIMLLWEHTWALTRRHKTVPVSPHLSPTFPLLSTQSYLQEALLDPCPLAISSAPQDTVLKDTVLGVRFSYPQRAHARIPLDTPALWPSPMSLALRSAPGNGGTRL